jgi:hypothetical protein
MRFKPHCLALLLGVCTIQAGSAAEGVVANEASLQAAFLYNFALFTEWPGLSATHFNICVAGSAAVLEALQPYQTKKIRDLPVVISNLPSFSQIRNCQIVFIGKSDHANIKNLPASIGQNPVMVVAEENSFEPAMVTILLVQQQGRIAFKINQTSALANSLAISSKLLKLALQVY